MPRCAARWCMLLPHVEGVVDYPVLRQTGLVGRKSMREPERNLQESRVLRGDILTIIVRAAHDDVEIEQRRFHQPVMETDY
jgi:hypothetical protein